MSDERDVKPKPKDDEVEQDDVEAHVKPKPANTEPGDPGDDVEAHIKVKP